MKSASFGGAKLEVEAMLTTATSTFPCRSGLELQINMLLIPHEKPDFHLFYMEVRGERQVQNSVAILCESCLPCLAL